MPCWSPNNTSAGGLDASCCPCGKLAVTPATASTTASTHGHQRRSQRCHSIRSGFQPRRMCSHTAAARPRPPAAGAEAEDWSNRSSSRGVMPRLYGTSAARQAPVPLRHGHQMRGRSGLRVLLLTGYGRIAAARKAVCQSEGTTFPNPPTPTKSTSPFAFTGDPRKASSGNSRPDRDGTQLPSGRYLPGTGPTCGSLCCIFRSGH